MGSSDFNTDPAEMQGFSLRRTLLSELNEELMEEETTEAAFDVTDDEKAEWCMAKIREHRQEIDKWTQHYEAEKKRVCI